MNKKICAGWRETMSLPELGIKMINVKLDTGAKTSCLHALDIKLSAQDGIQWVNFRYSSNETSDLKCKAKLIEQRVIRNSGGHDEMRYIIETLCQFNSILWPIEIGLTDRSTMKYNMLLGRSAMKQHIIVDPSVSFSVPFEDIQL